ncbi:2-amino-4-hydroxy-6-hydroxymethyldihydropteridine diphosphokinase [Dasania sp. GY-MA-18]|uniref:2-amino-4-hydroxy-6-hydroxymethyldihydropteridine pyrophosphokinase n=1 Tax=Dasania phycosphaerae TaxID=2950436 RepID=A0A9J6RS97_9GAMM|nr:MULTISPECIES: 2-amino-4-hydroxy-6-hydroxymethyldihydropteridine diphosphokinase [Dasania]MCR8924373.1 2-amino-4-hydroxy-6-hydroxymethyldihydropteridine diphosphokinase [Dasania sp. GY-MA-18]MCZ0867048.1 2-amino-4-hydroxy-6-hydroxymethyldihydropteridine diphosphokinase [Dasania phycosphaerae]MCZ0870500.1 2-amino-4-hydroxy-6-hydroxymethyldihydropteridine diphosphokinase [Dasania phycosphaerae]
MTLCFIGLGSNLANPQQQVNDAVKALSQLADTELLACSPWYRSTAIGPGQQDDYVNGAVMLNTQLSPLTLLDQLQAIEQQQQRVRIQRWGPRTLDLDLLAYGEQVIEQPRLSVPHPRIAERNFVIYPLYDLAPELKLANGLCIKSLRAQCGDEGLQRISDSEQ